MVKIFNEPTDPTIQVLQTQTKLLKQTQKNLSQQIRVCIPGIIINYDYKTQTCTVQPAFQNEYPDGTVQNMPPLYNVPVQHPAGGGAYIHVPLKSGDNCTIKFSDKSLELWKQSGKVSLPQDDRTHHIADAIVEPGLQPLSGPLKVSNGTDLILGMGTVELHLKPNGHFQVQTGLNTSGYAEFVTVINAFMTAAITADWGGMIGAQIQLQKFLER